ncbi:MAG: N-formylglutamate amidohydrolase [Alphaproteobacteria bacterium]
MSETIPGVYRLDTPKGADIPLVLDSPHSGSNYPGTFDTTVPINVLRRAEDMYVDDLFADGPTLGAPLVSALYPRSFIDPNRAVRDLDRDILEEPWPEPVHPTEKARFGHGLIWRVCPPDFPMYARRLSVAEVRERIDQYWTPYHQTLQQCMDETQALFGMAWHFNCHSMPSSSLLRESQFNSYRRADFVLGDRDGTTCDREFLNVVGATLKGFGYRVRINDPYKGVEIVRRHGRPDIGRHSLQIEINRALYMNEETFERTPYYATLKTHLSELIEVVGDYALGRAGAKAAE